MSEGQFDNNNRGACWPIKKAMSVKAEIAHRKFNGVLVATNATASNAPALNLYLRDQDKRHEVYCVAMFKKEDGGKKLAGGDFSLASGESFWVALFKNENENAKSPAYDLSFQAKDAEPAQQEASGYDDGPDGWF